MRDPLLLPYGDGDSAWEDLSGPQVNPFAGIGAWTTSAWKWLIGNRVERQAKYAKLGKQAVEELDDVDDFFVDQGAAEWEIEDPDEAEKRSFPIHKRDSRKTLRFAAVVAREVRIKMGPNPRYTEANEKVAWELAAKIMEERDVRKVDRTRYLPYATKMVFIPTEHDVHANQLGQSSAVAWRLHLARPARPWWWWRPWWGLRGLGEPSRT